MLLLLQLLPQQCCSCCDSGSRCSRSNSGFCDSFQLVQMVLGAATASLLRQLQCTAHQCCTGRWALQSLLLALHSSCSGPSCAIKEGLHGSRVSLLLQHQLTRQHHWTLTGLL